MVNLVREDVRMSCLVRNFTNPRQPLLVLIPLRKNTPDQSMWRVEEFFAVLGFPYAHGIAYLAALGQRQPGTQPDHGQAGCAGQQKGPSAAAKAGLE